MGIDFNKLRLKYHGDKEKMSELLQMECRSKCEKKLPLTLSNVDFLFPSLALAEMSTSDAVAKIHASLIDSSDTVLDMTAGLGIDTFHFAKAGCQVTAIELSHEAAIALEHNAKVLNLQNKMNVVESDSIKWLQTCGCRFDSIFIDPARRNSNGRHVSLSQCSPDVTQHLRLLLAHAKNIIIKMSPMIDIAAAKKELGIEHCEVIVIGTTKECKEVVFNIPGDIYDGNTKDEIRCVTVGRGEYSVTNFKERQYAMPIAGGYLMLPYPAVMKGSGGMVDGFKKLHPSTHLYYEDVCNDSFPGQNFSIIEIIPFNKKEIKAVKSRYPKLNVATRNFPLTAPELVKRLGIKEGGELTLFAATLYDESRVLIISKPVTNIV